MFSCMHPWMSKSNMGMVQGLHFSCKDPQLLLGQPSWLIDSFFFLKLFFQVGKLLVTMLKPWLQSSLKLPYFHIKFWLQVEKQKMGPTLKVIIVMAKSNGIWQMDVTTPNIIPFISNEKDENLPLVGLVRTCPMLKDVNVQLGIVLANVND